MKTPLSPIMRRRLLVGGNTIARAVLRSPTHMDADGAREDLRAALWSLITLAHCLHVTHPPKGRKRKCR
jgi:hypothetical protein